MPTYDRRNRCFDSHSDNNDPLDALPFGPRLSRNGNNNRSRPVFRPRNLPPRQNGNNYHHHSPHASSNHHRRHHSPNASNHHHHHHHDHHHRRHSPNASNHHHHRNHQHDHHQQQIVPFDHVEYYHTAMIWEGFELLSNQEDQYPVISREYRLQTEETMIVSNGVIQEWSVYSTLVWVDHHHHHDDAVEQSSSSSSNEGLSSEEEISNCLQLKSKGDDDSEEEGICVICQDDLFQHEEDEEGKQGANEKQKVAVISPCGHEYHYDCVAKWLQQKNSCPLCKAIPRPAL